MQDNGVSSYHRFLQGDTKALEEFVALYGDALVRFCYCFVRDLYAAEDIAEDSFAALIAKRKRFADEAHLRGYLFKTARNRCLSQLRKKKIAPCGELPDGEQLALERERDRTVYACLGRIAPQYRDVLYLVYFEGFKPEELERTLKKSRKQIYNLLARAKAALKEKLIKEGISDENL